MLAAWVTEGLPPTIGCLSHAGHDTFELHHIYATVIMVGCLETPGNGVYLDNIVLIVAPAIDSDMPDTWSGTRALSKYRIPEP